MKQIIIFTILFLTLANSTYATENLDQVCREDEESTLKAIYSVQKKSTSKEGIVVCGTAKSLLDTKNDFSVIQYKKSGKSIFRATLFESDDAFMIYEIKPGKDFFGIKESLANKSKSDPLFVYSFDCDEGQCSRKLKSCATQKTLTTGDALATLEKDYDKLQKLNKKNNSAYEKLIRQVFLDALAGDFHSVEFFKKKECGWNHYIDIDETCATYETILEENLKHPCR